MHWSLQLVLLEKIVKNETEQDINIGYISILVPVFQICFEVDGVLCFIVT